MFRNYKDVPIERPPAHLYKYRSLASEAARHSAQDLIVNGNAYFSSPLWFNDPFDCLPVGIVTGSRERRRRVIRRMLRKGPEYPAWMLREATESLLEKTLEEMAEIVQPHVAEVMGMFAVFCLGESPLVPLMWSHYADSHRGICVELNTEIEIETEQVTTLRRARRVIYTNDRPTVSFATQGIADSLYTTLSTKAEFWQYEREWRAFSFLFAQGVIPLSPDVITGVTLGARTSEEDEALVNSWVRQRQIPVPIRRAKIDPLKYDLHT